MSLCESPLLLSHSHSVTGYIHPALGVRQAVCLRDQRSNNSFSLSHLLHVTWKLLRWHLLPLPNPCCAEFDVSWRSDERGAKMPNINSRMCRCGTRKQGHCRGLQTKYDKKNSLQNKWILVDVATNKQNSLKNKRAWVWIRFCPKFNFRCHF